MRPIGQALEKRVGQMSILELRKKACDLHELIGLVLVHTANTSDGRVQPSIHEVVVALIQLPLDGHLSSALTTGRRQSSASVLSLLHRKLHPTTI
jgi:hypothetical protein